MSPTLSSHARTHSKSAIQTEMLETSFPKLSIRTQLRSFDYLPPELTTPIPHLISPGITAPPPTSNPFQPSFSSRYIPPDPKHLDSLPPINPPAHLQASLQILTTDHPPSAAAAGPTKGLLSGPTSIAYLFLQLSRTHPTLDVGTRTPSEWCREYLRAAASAHARHAHPRARGGIQDEDLAYACVKAGYTRDATYIRRALTHVRDSALDPGNNGWLHGRAGTLYLLRMLRAWTGDEGARAEIEGIIAELVRDVLAADRNGARWRWQGKEYVGAAHGDVGIITQLVLSAPGCVDEALLNRVSGILDEQLPSGNWPSTRSPSSSSTSHSHSHSHTHTSSTASLTTTSSNRSSYSKPAPHQDDLVQFCHGSPGLILSLQALLPHFPPLRSRIEDAIRRARDDVWARGFLAKEPCLCHGIAGNALAMDRVRRERMLRMATPEFVGRAIGEGWYVPGSDAYGLLWGEAGRAWVWAGAGMGAGGMVGYSDL